MDTFGRRWALVLPMLFAAVVVLGACGPEPPTGEKPGGDQGGATEARKPGEQDSKPAPVEAIRVAYKKTAAQSARFSMDFVTTGLPRPETAPPGPDDLMITMRMSGVMDLARDVGEFDTEMPPLEGRIEARQIGANVYQKFPEQMRAQTLPPGKVWVRTNADEMMRQQYGVTAAQMQGDAPSDLASGQLEYLRGVSESVEKVGEEMVRGFRTTRYRATMDLEESLTGESPEAREAYEKLRATIRTDTLPVEVWLDEEGRVRRYDMNVPMRLPEKTAAQGSAEANVRMVSEYYDFGVPVRVVPPPAEQTIGLDELVTRQTS